MIKLSITIATFNRAELLGKALAALANQSYSKDDYEVIVCDSNSHDETNEVVNHYSKFIDIKYVHCDNVLAAKRNCGIKNSKYPYVVFLDDDCVPENNFVEEYASCFTKNSIGQDKIIYCGRVVYPSNWVEESNYYRFRNSRHYTSNNAESLNFKTIVVMNMGFKKSDFIDYIGAVNERFVGYGCEDQELGWRIEQAGFKILTTAATITHFETTNSIDNYMIKMHRTGRDGMKTLISVAPDVAWSLPSSKLLEPTYPFLNFKDKFKSKITRYILLQLVPSSLLIFILNKSDKVKFLYCPFIYRVLMAKAFCFGTLERNKALSVQDSNKGWY